MKGPEIMPHAKPCWNFQPVKGMLIKRMSDYDVQLSAELSQEAQRSPTKKPQQMPAKYNKADTGSV